MIVDGGNTAKSLSSFFFGVLIFVTKIVSVYKVSDALYGETNPGTTFNGSDCLHFLPKRNRGRGGQWYAIVIVPQFDLLKR